MPAVAVRSAHPRRLKNAQVTDQIARLTEEDLHPIRALEQRLSRIKGQTISLVAYCLAERSE